MTRLALTLVTALTGFAGVAIAAPTDAEKAAFIKAVAANDCKLDLSEVIAVIGPAGLDRDDARAIALPMVQAGEASIDASGQILSLKTGPCA